MRVLQYGHFIIQPEDPYPLMQKNGLDTMQCKESGITKEDAVYVNL